MTVTSNIWKNALTQDLRDASDVFTYHRCIQIPARRTGNTVQETQTPFSTGVAQH